MPDVVVTENIVGSSMDSLRRDVDVVFDPHLWNQPKKLLDMVASAKALVVRNQTQVTAEVISAAKNLRVIARAGAGLNNIDVEAATRAGVVVAYTPNENSVAVAELTLGLLLALARKIPAADGDTRNGGWARRRFTGVELMGKTLGVVGLGRIGTLTAARARAFGMRIIAHGGFRDPPARAVAALEVEWMPLDDLLARADFVTCHVPLTDATRNLFNYDRFAKMKPGAMFVNTSRGEVVDEAGLLRALEEGRLKAAALDVRHTEPPARGPLAEMENVILMPHVGAFTEEAQHRVVASVCRDVRAVLQGGEALEFANFASPRLPQSRSG